LAEARRARPERLTTHFLELFFLFRSQERLRMLDGAESRDAQIPAQFLGFADFHFELWHIDLIALQGGGDIQLDDS
jgi:hypothetical protein